MSAGRYAVHVGGRWITEDGERMLREPTLMQLGAAVGAALRMGVPHALLVPEELLPHVGDEKRARVACQLVVAELVPTAQVPDQAAS